MYPNLMQNYQCYPVPTQVPNPYANAQVNAVKIDINEPKAYGGVNSDGKQNPVACPYTYPYAPMYNMPTVGQYITPNSYPQPVLTNYVPTAQVPVANPIQQQPAVATVVPEANNAVPVQPVTPQVVPAPVIIPPVPVVPQPTAQTPAVNAPVTQEVNIGPQTEPKAVVDTKQTTQPETVAQPQPQANAKPVEPVPPVQPQTTTDASVDVNGIVTALSSTNTDEQTAAIQKIAELAQTNPVAAKGLLNEQVFGKLVNIINADTSKLEGPKGTPDPKNLSPLEKAEINKQFAVYTLAILQKNFREEINQLMKKNNLPDIAINDIPFIKEGIVNNLKDNPNPTIREACLSALNYIGRPEDKEVLKTLYDISAKHDASPEVQKTAADYLSKLPA